MDFIQFGLNIVHGDSSTAYTGTKASANGVFKSTYPAKLDTRNPSMTKLRPQKNMTLW